MESITRAVCASISRIEGSVMDQLMAVRNDLCGPESKSRTRVALFYISGWLVMLAEGSEAGVDAALQRAAEDPRNHHQKLLHRSRGPASLHDRIVVASTQSRMRPSQFANWVMHMKNEGASLEPMDIVNRLAAPCLVDASRHPCTRPLRQIAFVGTDDQAAVDPLRKLGDRFASPVIYQRFAFARQH